MDIKLLGKYLMWLQEMLKVNKIKNSSFVVSTFSILSLKIYLTDDLKKEICSEVRKQIKISEMTARPHTAVQPPKNSLCFARML